MKLPRFVSATGFDFLLPIYDPLVALLTRERVVKSHLLDRADLQAGQRILDVGCGTGTLMSLIQGRMPATELVGVDVDSRVLGQAQRKLEAPASTAKLHAATSTHLPVADSCFDVVFCSLMLHHLQPAEKVLSLAEMFRALVPGGKLLLADFCKPADPYARFAFFAVRLVDGWSRTRCNAQGKLPALIAESGFASVCSTLQLSAPLGTIRSYEAIKPNA